MNLVLVRGMVSIAVYFSVLGTVLIYSSTRVVRSNIALFKRRRELNEWGRFDMYSALFFVVLSIMAGVSTWYYIGGFFRETFLSDGQGNWQLWVEKSDLFVQAYRLVSQSKWQWFWSSQLLMAACSFVGFLLMSGRKDAWAFVLLGFLGAISLALALFLSDQIARRSSSRLSGLQDPIDRASVLDSQLHRLVSWPTIAGLFSIMANSLITPTSPLYMPNLIFLHVILFLPVIAFMNIGRTNLQGWKPFWFVTASIIAIYMIYHWSLVGWEAHSQGLLQIGKSLVSAVHTNNCQTSITLDLFYVTVAIICGVAWALISRQKMRVGEKATPFLSMVPLLLMSLLFSPAFAFPLFLALDGDELFSRVRGL